MSAEESNFTKKEDELHDSTVQSSQKDPSLYESSDETN